MSAGKGNDLPVDQAHTVEDVTQVLVALLGVGQTAIGRDLREGGREGRGRELVSMGEGNKALNRRPSGLT
jgi:hypothetical protein